MSETVLKISTPLANKSTFVKIDQDMSIDRAISEAITTLSNSGKPLESQQLAQLYKQHQLFNNGKVVGKGSLISELDKETQVVNTQEINVVSLDLVMEHSGGLDLGEPDIENFKKNIPKMKEDSQVFAEQLERAYKITIDDSQCPNTKNYTLRRVFNYNRFQCMISVDDYVKLLVVDKDGNNKAIFVEIIEAIGYCSAKTVDGWKVKKTSNITFKGKSSTDSIIEFDISHIVQVLGTD